MHAQKRMFDRSDIWCVMLCAVTAPEQWAATRAHSSSLLGHHDFSFHPRPEAAGR